MEKLPEIPKGIELIFPYNNPGPQKIIQSFYQKFYQDTEQRSLILGINPGRHGAGTTGIPFTDGKRLFNYCEIEPDNLSHEPSSEFVYETIEAYGGVNKFYKDFFISSVSPLGFTKNGKNLNYYDDSVFQKSLKPYISYQLLRLLDMPLQLNHIICWGEGKNYAYLKQLNSELSIFGTIKALAHPRFIIQYKRKHIREYIKIYVDAFHEITLTKH
ncbi:MAG: DUF4918 family protein [Bacteroidota bacterium]|nr:DUF4918 family protein [Bacteroidota bacterium]